MWVCSTASASTAWLVGRVKEGEKEESYTYTDENGEEQTETYTYDVYRSALFQIDLDSQTCTEATGVALPQVDEGWEGSVNVSNMQVMGDGSIWVCCDIYQYKTELPEDFDPETDDEWNYQQNEEKDVMLHLAADGSELGRFELKVPAEPDDAGNSYSSSLSTVLVGDDGTIYGYDWTNVYLFDAEGNCTATISTDDIGGGSVQISQVRGRRYENTSDVEAEADGSWYSFEGSEQAFHDTYPVTLLSPATTGDRPMRRFRPNLVVDGPEDGLVGATVRIGGAVVDVAERVSRCVMVTRSQPGGIEVDRDVLRWIHRERGGVLAVGGAVVRPGLVRLGDEVVPA